MSASLPRVLTVVGARPQFVKAAAVCHALSAAEAEPDAGLHQRILHTGQHFDPEMSRVFFSELGIPEPDVNLGVRESSHARMTASMLVGIERELSTFGPDLVLVYGDTNSTLAGALAAAKLHVPVAHVEAGLRSFDRLMPEEINRVLTDHLSALLFAPTEAAVENLGREGITSGVHRVGDVMLDAIRIFSRKAQQANVLQELELEPGKYVLTTCHRAENVDSAERFGRIVDGLKDVGAQLPVVFPVHPRTRQRIDAQGLQSAMERAGIILTHPRTYLEMLALLGSAAALITDSGGMQKEAYVLGVPCITARAVTEWVETIHDNANRLVDDDPKGIAQAALDLSWFRPGDAEAHYGAGEAGRLIVERLLEFLG